MENKQTFPRLDRTVLSIGTLFEESDVRQYWLNQSIQSRMIHMERLRRINYGDLALTRLQRFLEIAERERS